MQRKEPVTVEQVANGYIVRPEPNLARGRDFAVITSANDTHVFETFDGLSTFLREHFEPTPAQFNKPIAANP